MVYLNKMTMKEINFMIIITILFIVIIILLLMILKNSKFKIKEDEVLRLKLGLSEDLNRIGDKLYLSNEKIAHQLLDFKRETSDSILKSNKQNIDSIFNFNNNLKQDLNADFKNLTDIVEKRLDKINSDVEVKLDKSFESTRKTFSNVMESLGRLDEAQKKMEFLSNNVQNLNNVLTDKKTRGIFGEIQLYQILKSAFGENNEIYTKQYKLSNNFIADAVLFAPEPLGTICIDSKFPLENYRRIFEDNSNKLELDKLFSQNLKKHIDDISSKYIINGETTNHAILFLPAEAIFAYINAYHLKIVDYAYEKKVWITSPTTMMAILTTIQAITQNLKQSEYAYEIQRELASLSIEFERYIRRWELLEKDITKVSKDVKDIYNTSNKISKKFDSIKNVEVKNEIENIE